MPWRHVSRTRPSTTNSTLYADRSQQWCRYDRAEGTLALSGDLLSNTSRRTYHKSTHARRAVPALETAYDNLSTCARSITDSSRYDPPTFRKKQWSDHPLSHVFALEWAGCEEPRDHGPPSVGCSRSLAASKRLGAHRLPQELVARLAAWVVHK